MSDIPVITIDGPVASGKGTVARRLAQALGFHCLESGLLYRLVGFLAQKNGIPLDDEGALGAAAKTIDLALLSDGNLCLLLQDEPIGKLASTVAVYGKVRQALLDAQRQAKRMPGLVAEGRDMGTVVFPEAKLKVFLTASIEARAERRLKQLIDQGKNVNLTDLLQEISSRDARDKVREKAPLLPAKDAWVVDTTAMNAEEVVKAILRRAQRLGIER